MEWHSNTSKAEKGHADALAGLHKQAEQLSDTIETQRHRITELGGELALQAIDWQDALYMNPPPAMDELSPEARKRIERIIQGNRSIHASFREAFIKQAPRG